MSVLVWLAVLATPAYVALIRLSLPVPNGTDMGHRINIRAIIATAIAVLASAWISSAWIFGQIYQSASLWEAWWD